MIDFSQLRARILVIERILFIKSCIVCNIHPGALNDVLGFLKESCYEWRDQRNVEYF